MASIANDQFRRSTFKECVLWLKSRENVTCIPIHRSKTDGGMSILPELMRVSIKNTSEMIFKIS